MNKAGTYTLKEIFSDKEKKIIIPDIQRDYCWGDRDDLVSSFVEGLVDLKGKNTDRVTLGMIYGYEEPEKSGRIYLCDGQQRLTTLFLLLGLINRKVSHCFNEYLGDNGDGYRNPRLLYSIRESTLYFLSDLTYEFFMKEGEEYDITEGEPWSEYIKKQPWYFSDYDNDPSIDSILKALDCMKCIVDGLSNPEGFGYFILNKLEFIYYDLGNRVNGEETFVLINTTGEPLTPTENLKPRLISSSVDKEGDSNRWEAWEQFFWRNRADNDTADNGLNEFFRWIAIINLSIGERDEDALSILRNGKYGLEDIIKNGIGDVDEYFHIVERIAKEKIVNGFSDYIAPKKTGNKGPDRLKIIPSLLYVKKFPKAEQKSIRRIFNFFDNLARSGKAGDDIPKCIKIVNAMENEDILSLLEIDRKELISAISEEEVVKLEIIKKECSRREEVETEFNFLQRSPYFEGNIMPLLKWSSDSKLSSESFNFDDFKKYSKTFKDVFTDWKEENPSVQENLDVVRRTLLIFAPTNYWQYPFYATNWTFCSEVSEWRALLHREENSDWLQKFFDSLKNDASTSAMEKMCLEEYENPKRHMTLDLQYLLKYPEILKAMQNKRLYWVEKGSSGFWLILTKKNISSLHTSLINFVMFQKIKEEFEDKHLLAKYKPEWKLDDFYWWEECSWIHRQENYAGVSIHSTSDDNLYLMAWCIDKNMLEKLESSIFHFATEEEIQTAKESPEEVGLWMKSIPFDRGGMPEMTRLMEVLKNTLASLS